MKFPFFDGKRQKPQENAWKAIPPPRFAMETLPEFYEADERLADAVNVALILGKPLLLTGEPGTGKTQLAYRLAWELGFDMDNNPLVFETKSNSLSRDLFYIYNTLGRFQDIHCGNGNHGKAKEYITYNALGLAILRANEPESVKDYLPEDFTHKGSERSVVLIDEIDKAPRDFPNDILNEIERMYFHIPELGLEKITARPEMSPVVVITSNSEKHLPDPFLRRCVYHHIEFPEPEQMKRIVEARIAYIPDSDGKKRTMDTDFLSDILALFYELRKEEQGFSKKPSTAELIVWIQAIREFSDAKNPVREDRKAVVKTLGALVKTEDIQRAGTVVREWKQP
jgi:MoxR-like ATPase